ncbi:spore germination protein [Cohnella sp. GCM10027633]|uniref:spore germination protein n=1 Tax=unclassified Cohnella TaxID=2636738 RepID=UPI00362AF3AB
MANQRTNSDAALGISDSLPVNLQWVTVVFKDCEDIVIEEWRFGPDHSARGASVYCRSFVEDSANHFVRMALQDMVPHRLGPANDLNPSLIADYYENGGVSSQPFLLLGEQRELQDRVLEGDVVVMIDGWDRAIAYSAATVPRRQVTEPIEEPSVKGPREGTIEHMESNLALLRQRMKSPELKIKFLMAGGEMRTRIAYLYLEHIVDRDTLDHFRSRLKGIEQYEVQDTSYIEEWIEDSTLSPFPQYRYTQRTDSAAAALLDGKILVLVDNSPMIMIAPGLLVDFLSTSEDYYTRTTIATLIRLLRLFAMIIALMLPSIYIALSTFHPELIPTVLLLAILDTREGIPFPAFIEALIMEIAFELLREAGIRLPRQVGPAVSIVGALVIGQAAIMAKIASPIMVIVVAFTGIASFTIPHYEMAAAIRIVRFPLMLASGLIGGFGIMIVSLLLLLHLTSLHTLGQPYLSSLAPLRLRDLRDIFVRISLKSMLRSPRNRRLAGKRAGERT